MNCPQSYPRPRCSFDRLFLHHVLPRLRLTAILGGVLIDNNLELFEDAASRVMRVALKFGATRLSSRCFDELQDWIGRAVLAAADADPPPWLIPPDRLAALTNEYPQQNLRYGGNRR